MGKHQLDNTDDTVPIGEWPEGEVEPIDRPPRSWRGRVLTAVICAPLIGLVVMLVASSTCTYGCGQPDPLPAAQATLDVSDAKTSLDPSALAEFSTPLAPSSTPGPIPASPTPRPPMVPTPTRPAPARTITSPPTSAPAAPPEPWVPGIGIVVGVNGMCMDLNGAVMMTGNRVQIWTCNSTVAQTVTAGVDGTLRFLGLCLGGLNDTMTEGILLEVWTCDEKPSQQWRFVDGTIVHPSTGLCLDTEGRGTGNGTRLTIVGCDGGNTQRWTPPPPG